MKKAKVISPLAAYRAIQIAGAKPAYYTVGWEDRSEYWVFHTEDPDRFYKMTRKEFEARYITEPPTDNPKIRAIWDSMELYVVWHEKLIREGWNV